jgi:hypothetical protein
MPRASGSFTVDVRPQPSEPGVGDASIGRMALHKRFEGGLRGEALGQMLAMRSPVDGSAAYVALDRFEGALDGRRGGFSLQHRGVMDRGAASLEVQVVPDSGSEELTGLRGSLLIRVDGKQHAYDFDYSLPEATAG